MSFKTESQVLQVDGKTIVVDEDGTMTIGPNAEAAAGAAPAGPVRETAEIEYFTGGWGCRAWGLAPAALC